MRYKRDEGTTVFANILHIIPIMIAENTLNGINNYGLDEKYVAGGAIINKIFDYQNQAPITRLAGHNEAHTENYRFIGDLTNYNFLPRPLA